MASAYHEALLLRLRHIVGVRRNTKLWTNTGDVGRTLIKRSLWAAMSDAEREDLGNQMMTVITPSERDWVSR